MISYKNHIMQTIKVLEELIPSSGVKVENAEYFNCPYKKGEILPYDSAEFRPYDGVLPLGKDSHAWLRFSLKAEDRGENLKPYLRVNTANIGAWDALNPQCMLYIDGELKCGLDINHREFPIKAGKNHEVYIYIYSGMNDIASLPFSAELIYKDEAAKKLYYDMKVPFDAACVFPEHYEESVIILKYLEAAADMIDFREPGSEKYYSSLKKAEDFLENEFYSKVCGRENTLCDGVFCIGHTHIDVAWLWTYAQTKEKAQRSFSTVLSLMERYPEYKFMSSQPQLYEYLKEESPKTYERVKKAVAEGRWEPEGAMWVEADCNLISGESMIRQILFGKRFFREEFGKESEILWLPDVFGYSAMMPQILKKTGVSAFVTSKISWNDTNMMPHDTFLWQGIDGTEIFSYFLTAQDSHLNNPVRYTTYVGNITPRQVLGTWERYQDKAYNASVALTFGYGDGGGGPTEEMLEAQRRTARKIPGIPKTVPAHPSEFIKTAKENFEKNIKLLPETPRWVGELYLENHRGTYTNAAKNKKFNRKSELLLGRAEALTAFGMLMGREYPEKELRSLWHDVLLNQFHDVVPGSSIKEVYDDTDKMYERILSDGERLFDGALSKMAENITTKKGFLVYNPNSFAASGRVNAGGEEIFVRDVPAFGWKNVIPEKKECSVKTGGLTAENEFFRLELSENGAITSLYDKRNARETVKKDSGGIRYVLCEDRPFNHDAWNIERYSAYKTYEAEGKAEISTFSDGASKGFTVKTVIGKAEITEKIRLYDETDRVDFNVHVLWNEDHYLLRKVFPFDVKTDKLNCDIGMGYVERTGHDNTSWDEAKFETVMHKWADVSEPGFGVSVINDSKYGVGSRGGEIAVSILKAASYPNPESDRGEHTFGLSVYPHGGRFTESRLFFHAYEFNNPLIAKECGDNEGSLPGEFSLLGARGAIIDTVKKAEDSDDIIIRLYEPEGKRTKAKIDFGFDFKEAYFTDISENEEKKAEVISGTIETELSPFEIVTLKIKK